MKGGPSCGVPSQSGLNDSGLEFEKTKYWGEKAFLFEKGPQSV